MEFEVKFYPVKFGHRDWTRLDAKTYGDLNGVQVEVWGIQGPFNPIYKIVIRVPGLGILGYDGIIHYRGRKDKLERAHAHFHSYEHRAYALVTNLPNSSEKHPVLVKLHANVGPVH